jgi:mRNA-degrading endonuclease RelE of RelBE toxin-antitoxin system
MKVTFDYLDEFARGAKVLRKKYPSFESDYETFLDELEKNPFSGEPLGKHTYKNRMAIASKGKGKSGGARVITYNVQQKADDEVLITLMTIYDKSDIDNVSDSYLRSLVQEIEGKINKLK